MIHTFTNKSLRKGFRGFTLIELLVVIAIIGLLSTIIAAPIQNARKKARDAKKIAEIKSVQLALDQYAEANAGQYPQGLGYLSPTYMPLLPSFASTTITSVSDKDKFAFAPYVIFGPSVGRLTYAYHLGVHLENFSQGLDNDRDCLGADNTSSFQPVNGTSTCAFYPASGANTDSLYVSSSTPNGDNYSGAMLQQVINPSPNKGTPTTAGVTGTDGDFSGSDGDIAKCNATTDCVFDVTAQQ